MTTQQVKSEGIWYLCGPLHHYVIVYFIPQDQIKIIVNVSAVFFGGFQWNYRKIFNSF